MKYRLQCAAAVAAFAVFATDIQAQDCKPLGRYASVPLSTSSDFRRLYVPVEIAGKPMRMLLDTGASVTLINASTAKALGLETHDSPIRVYSLTGDSSDKYVETSFKISAMSLPKFQFPVSKQFEDLDQSDVVGLLGANVLSHFDVSVDPVGKTLDLMSQDHCPDRVIYWPTKVLAKIPFKPAEDGSIIVEIKLDGKPVKAILDTGAWNSTLRIPTAEHLYNITPGSPDAPVSGILNGAENLTTYHHTFKTLDFDGVTVANPAIELIPDKLSRPFTEVPTGSHISVTDEGVAPPMLIGMDILRHTRFYIAYKAHMLYVTPPTEPAAAPAPAK